MMRLNYNKLLLSTDCYDEEINESYKSKLTCLKKQVLNRAICGN